MSDQIVDAFLDPGAPCHLCGSTAGLQLSHVIPAFVYKWMRDSSATGFMRTAEEPNRRRQDGLKCHLLCRECEQRFSDYERQFARVFAAFNENLQSSVLYDDWLIRFAASLSWRVNRVLAGRAGAVEDLPDWARAHVREADETLRGFLLGLREHPAGCSQHVMILDRLEQGSPFAAGLRMNQYLLRGIQTSLITEPDCVVTVAKLGRFLFLGHLTKHDRALWRGTRIALRGRLVMRDYGVPGSILTLLKDSAAAVADAAGSISDKQSAVIESAMQRDPERALRSGSFDAMLADNPSFKVEN